MTKTLFLLFSIGFLNCPSYAFSKGISLANYKPEDGEYKYFIGVGDSSKGQIDAFQTASLNAFQNASASLFGVYVQTDLTTLEKISDVDYSKKNKLSTDKVKFIKFELVDSLESKDQVFEARLLFRYPKSEYEKELERLKAVSESNVENAIDAEFNEIGSNTSHAQILVRTFYRGKEVSDANVYINGEKIAFTPLKLRKKLKIGLNRLEVIHPKFKDYIKDFDLKELKDLDFQIELKPAMSLVIFSSDEPETKVYINNDFVGMTPLNMNLSILRKFDIKFVKEGFEDVIVSKFQVQKGDYKELKIQMIKKVEPIDDSEFGCADEATEDDSI
jgi:hypothetical protein